MITTLSTRNPDTNQMIPVTVHWANVPVIDVDLHRKDVEGNPRALNANVKFGPVVGAPGGREDYVFNINLDVQTANHEVRMTDGHDKATMEHLQDTWELASTSGGEGAILSVEIWTTLT